MTTKTKEKPTLTPDQRLELAVRLAEAAPQLSETIVRLGETTARLSDAVRDRLPRTEAKVEKILTALDKSRENVDELMRAVEIDRKNNEGHRRSLSRALEDEFIASLPRAMEELSGIIIRPDDIRAREDLRSLKGGAEGEIDFIAPNGKEVLVGEVKTHLTQKDVDAFFGVLDLDFRGWFPEYDGRPVIGVVAGARIDKPAELHAIKRGFFILRLEGAEIHPATGENFQPTEY